MRTSGAAMDTFKRLTETTSVWRRRAAARRRLRQHILETLSVECHRRIISPPALIREAGKPFWRA